MPPNLSVILVGCLAVFVLAVYVYSFYTVWRARQESSPISNTGDTN